ncbi:hypothetical protein Nepgr_006742 [Nepenthes gracilis]|uniref:Uncharacterized protein n=1 Tax=Nepenthes gracilis TaxID=150966 RepID=A0AAD3XHL6_NEPGR|nr:hypothetical protein Nepgr_006742 [Nepenthes gracilis]
MCGAAYVVWNWLQFWTGSCLPCPWITPWFISAADLLPFGISFVTMMQIALVFFGTLESRFLLCCCCYVFNNQRWSLLVSEVGIVQNALPCQLFGIQTIDVEFVPPGLGFSSIRSIGFGFGCMAVVGQRHLGLQNCSSHCFLSPAPCSLKSADGFLLDTVGSHLLALYRDLLDLMPNMCISHVTLRKVGMYVYVVVGSMAVGD